MPRSYDLPDDDWLSMPDPEPIEPTGRIERLKTGLSDAIQAARDFVSEHLPGRSGGDDEYDGYVSSSPSIWDDLDLPTPPYDRGSTTSSSTAPSSSVRDIFGDDWLNSMPDYDYDDRTRLEKAKDGVGDAARSGWEFVGRHKRSAAAVLALSAVTITAIAVGARGGGHESGRETAVATSTTTTEDWYDYDPETGEIIIKDGGVEINSNDQDTTTTTQPIESETTKKYESLIMDRSDLPDVGSTPITLTPEQQEEQPGVGLAQALAGIDSSPESYPESQFVASYKSITGVEFNIYSANLDHSTQRYELNPVAIEFVLALLKQELPNAPENSNKENVLNNLQRIQDGEERRILDIVIDMSEDPSCIDPSYQLIRYTEEACAALGVTSISAGTDERTSEQMPILITDAGDRHWETQDDGTREVVSERDKTQGDETATIMHEVGVHALDELTMEEATSTDHTVNAYEEGDDAHENSAYLGIGGDPADFDMKGAHGKPLDLLKVMQELGDAKKLPPLLTPAN